MRTVVLVTGSRDWTDYGAIADALILYEPRDLIVLHGGARGADSLAARWCKQHGVNQWVLPYFGDEGRRGGGIRNQGLVNVARALHVVGYRCFAEAFLLPQSIGTRDCLRRIRRANEKVPGFFSEVREHHG